jgi:predicted nucleic acid-binding protein
MILVDSSVWIEHLRKGSDKLKELLGAGQVIIHAFVIGELALGHLSKRDLILRYLQDLPQAIQAGDEEVLKFITGQSLSATGIGYVDVHLLASARLTSAALWTHDRRLKEVAGRLGLGYAF